MDFESKLEKIVKDIRDREDKELALAFTNVVGSLLRDNGVFVKTSRYELETDNETDKNKYIIKKEYGFSCKFFASLSASFANFSILLSFFEISLIFTPHLTLCHTYGKT